MILFLIGLLLLVIAIPVPRNENSRQEDMSGLTDGRKTDGKETQAEQEKEAEAYEVYLEKRVAEVLEYVEGVGEAEVIITLKSTGQKVIEKDQISNGRTMTEEDASGGRREEKENTSEKTTIYEQYEDGSQSPYVSREIMPEIEGVVVVAQGGDRAVVVQNITEAIQALFGIEAHKIKIMKRTTTGT